MNTTNKKVPSLRFPEFSEEWEEKKLGEVAKSIESGKTKPNQSGNYLVYGSMGSIGFTDLPTYSGNYLLIARVGANAGTIYKISGDFSVTDNTLVFICDDNENFNLDFIFHELKSFNLNRLAFGSGQPLVTTTQLKKITFPFPSLPEQQKIADFLSAVDTRLQTLKDKKEKLETYKRGVMQQIFSQEFRFTRADGSPYPDWEEKKLGEVGNTFNGLTGKSADNFGKGYPYIQYKQIFDETKINTTKCGYVEIFENEKQNKVQFGDIFFTTSSETPNEIGFTSVLLDIIEDDIYLNSFCFGFRPNSLNEFNPHFARYLFHSQDIRKDIIKLAQGSTRFNMSKVEFMKNIILLPSFDEQKQIANFLSAIDHKIALVGQQIDSTEQYKKGLLQQMFV